MAFRDTRLFVMNMTLYVFLDTSIENISLFDFDFHSAFFWADPCCVASVRIEAESNLIACDVWVERTQAVTLKNVAKRPRMLLSANLWEEYWLI